MALVLRNSFAANTTGFNVTNGSITGAKLVPTSYASDMIATYATISGLPDMRMQVTVHGSAIRNVGVFCRKADSVASLSADHYLGKFTIGGTVGIDAPPAWNDPDTITGSKYISAASEEIEPSNTSSLLLTPAIGNAISLRDERLSDGDTIGCMVLDDQFFVLVNGIIRWHEAITGLDAVGYVGLIAYADAAADTAFTNFYSSDLTPRYVSKDAAASDSNGGTNKTTDAWSTIKKLATAQVTDEVGLVDAGTYGKVWMHDATTGTPRAPADLDDAIYVIALADQSVEIAAHGCLLAKSETNYLYTYNISCRNTIEKGANEPVEFFAGGAAASSKHNVFQGGKVSDGWTNGMGLFSGTDDEGEHKVIDVYMKGNGRNTGSNPHNIYYQAQDGVIAWCLIEGTSDHQTWADTQTIGYGVHAFASGGGSVGVSNTVVKYNTIRDHTTAASAGIIMSHGTDMQCIGNRISNCSQGIEVKFGAVDCLVANNIIYECTNDGIELGGQASSFDTGSLIYNNTVADCTGTGILGLTDSLNALVTNNVVFGNLAAQINTSGSPTGWTETTNFETDPSFNDATNDDYSLAEGSSAATGGTTLSEVTTDVLGYGRPQGATYARGAHEIPNPPLSAPTIQMDPAFSATAGDTISLVIKVLDADGDPRKLLINKTGTFTLAVGTPGSATIKQQ